MLNNKCVEGIVSSIEALVVGHVRADNGPPKMIFCTCFTGVTLRLSSPIHVANFVNAHSLLLIGLEVREKGDFADISWCSESTFTARRS